MTYTGNELANDPGASEAFCEPGALPRSVLRQRRRERALLLAAGLAVLVVLLAVSAFVIGLHMGHPTAG